MGKVENILKIYGDKFFLVPYAFIVPITGYFACCYVLYSFLLVILVVVCGAISQVE